MEASGIRVLHAIPGRIRLRIDAVRNDDALATEIEHRLARIEGIHRVVASSATGSVLVQYEVPAAASAHFLETLAKEAHEVIPTIDVENLARTWFSTNGSHSEAPEPLARRLTDAMAAVNDDVASVTGGVDLRLLVPLALVLLGVRGLLFDRPLGCPTWYDMLWFGFGTFVALNPPTAEPRPRTT